MLNKPGESRLACVPGEISKAISFLQRLAFDGETGSLDLEKSRLFPGEGGIEVGACAGNFFFSTLLYALVKLSHGFFPQRPIYSVTRLVFFS